MLTDSVVRVAVLLWNNVVNRSMASPLAGAMGKLRSLRSDYAEDALLIAVSLIAVSGLYLLASSLIAKFH
jgi:hypothetical protein